MKELLGKKITRLFVDSEDQGAIMFVAGDEEIIYDAVGDCCSETWFADITGVDALIGGTISGVEIIDIGEVDDKRGRQEYDEAYGYKITTEKGYVDIVYRNSSNGYYGGWCEIVGSHAGKMEEVTDDWSA